MLPTPLQHVRAVDAPWSPLEDDDKEDLSLPVSPRLVTQPSRMADTPVPVTRMRSLQGADRSGRRHGPQSHDARQNAIDVRKERTCLRCFVRKETCDTSKDICQNCSNKQARTWKLGCVRPRLMFRSNYLVPGKCEPRHHKVKILRRSQMF